MTDTPELPKLPVMHEPLNLIHPPSLLRMVVDYANAHGLACYEAGRGDARDAEKLREAVSRLLVLARLANWEGDDAAVFGQAALDDNTKGAE